MQSIFLPLLLNAMLLPAVYIPVPQQNKLMEQPGRETKWTIFWKEFTTAIYAKDKNKIATLTSKDFYDGGGGTVIEWLDAEVFRNDQSFKTFKAKLAKGAKSYKGFGAPYKATGQNKSGDLFFEYKSGNWLFGGLVGD
jgi:hypothetical protein